MKCSSVGLGWNRTGSVLIQIHSNMSKKSLLPGSLYLVILKILKIILRLTICIINCEIKSIESGKSTLNICFG